MRSTFLLLLTSLLTFCNAFAQESRPSHLYARSNLTDCQDILDSNALNQTCYDVLGIDAYIKSWNLTTTTCLRGELWANCFMREAGAAPEDGLGCAQMGPNTCNEPTADLVATATVEQIYTASSIWALQQLYTAIYDDLIGENGTEYISSAWASMTTPVTGKSLLATILNSDKDPRTQFLGLQVMSRVAIPDVDPNVVIPNQAAAPKVLGSVLASYLESAMTNFTLGGYWGMANHGKLLV